MTRGRPDQPTDTLITRALDIYAREGARPAATYAGVTTRTIVRWGRRAGVSSGYVAPTGPQAPHGTPARYSRHGCRCATCRAANTRAGRDRREQRRTVKETHPVNTTSAYADLDRFSRSSYLADTDEPIDIPDAAVTIADRHGLLAAAQWANTTVGAVVAWRTERGGRPHDTPPDPTARLDCDCRRCIDIRAELMHRSNIAHAGTRSNLELALAGRPGWYDRAACAGANPDPFFPTTGESTDAAKAVCAGCPVADECLTYALDNHIVYGIWGGTSERERSRIRRTRPAPDAA